MEDYVRRRHIEEGFSYVGTPHISKEALFHTSGHLPYYADTMFPPMESLEGAKYQLKAMSCPMHNLIYQSRGRSYRELPLRLFEFGGVYRYEKSGVVHGLTRVWDYAGTMRIPTSPPSRRRPRSSTCSTSYSACWGTSASTDYFYLELSTRDTEGEKSSKFIGSDEQWEAATKVLEEVATASGLELVPDPAARPSTVRRSRCRRATPSAAPGRCRRSSTTSTSPSASASSTRPPTGRASSRS